MGRSFIRCLKKIFARASASGAAQPENHAPTAPVIICTDLLSPPHNTRHYTLVAPAPRYEAALRRMDVFVCAAMAAKTIGIWWDCPPPRGIIAAALRSDNALIASYKNAGWQSITATDQILSLPNVKNSEAEMCYFIADNRCLQHMALMLTRGTPAAVKEPLAHLQKLGVGPEHLAAIARGHTNRRLLEMAYDNNSIGKKQP